MTQTGSSTGNWAVLTHSLSNSLAQQRLVHTCCVSQVHISEMTQAKLQAVEIVVRGRHEEIDFENQKQDDTETSIKTILVLLRYRSIMLRKF